MEVLECCSRAIQKRGTRNEREALHFPLLSRGTQRGAWKPAGEQRKARTAGAYRSFLGRVPHAVGDRSKRVKYLPMTARRMNDRTGRVKTRGAVRAIGRRTQKPTRRIFRAPPPLCGGDVKSAGALKSKAHNAG